MTNEIDHRNQFNALRAEYFVKSAAVLLERAGIDLPDAVLTGLAVELGSKAQELWYNAAVKRIIARGDQAFTAVIDAEFTANLKRDKRFGVDYCAPAFFKDLPSILRKEKQYTQVMSRNAPTIDGLLKGGV